MTEIALILFDLNGVLYRYDRDARIASLSAIANCPPDCIKAAIWESGFEDTGDTGALDATAYLQGFGQRIGYALTEAEWVAAQKAAITPIAATLGLLPRLRPGVRCALLTNNNVLVQRHFATFYPEAAALAGNRACVSAEFGARKPDPEVYRLCLARLGCEPAASLFIDDSAANVTGAEQAGMAGLLYTGTKPLAAALRARGLLSSKR